MSSPTSLQPQLDADALAAFCAAAAQVAEDSLFAFAEPCEPGPFADSVAAVADGEPWLAASVAFRGPFHGRAALTLPHAAAVELCAAFCGADAADLDESQIADFVGEFANMMCGLWLTRDHGHERFDLDGPRVRAGARPGPDRATDGGRLLVNDQPVLLSLHDLEHEA